MVESIKTVPLHFHRFHIWVTILTLFGHFVTQTCLVIKAKERFHSLKKKKKKPWSGSGSAWHLLIYKHLYGRSEQSIAWRYIAMHCHRLYIDLTIKQDLAFNPCVCKIVWRSVGKCVQLCLNSCTCSFAIEKMQNLCPWQLELHLCVQYRIDFSGFANAMQGLKL